MSNRFHLFEVTGIELEYMIVRKDSLDVNPAADELILLENGEITEELVRGVTGWSNELALHVIELKTPEPVRSLRGLAASFQKDIIQINSHLLKMDSLLLPTAMHPWMDPVREMKLWPHGHNEIYEKFNRIFNCTGHGWSNLQSVHINLPFSTEEEFGLLHAAIRVILPLIPAIASSSPVIEGTITGFSDTRLEVYRHNQDKIPQIAGQIIPEPCYTFQDYHDLILKPSFDAIRPYDPEGILQEEWLNSRGAIARFERGSIEIRLVDIQETPFADLAICTLIVETLKSLVYGGIGRMEALKRMKTEKLSALLFRLIREGSQGGIDDPEYLACFDAAKPLTALELWEHLYNQITSSPMTDHDPALLKDSAPYLETLFRQGTLSDRILRRLNGRTDRETLAGLYRELAGCLALGRMLETD